MASICGFHGLVQGTGIDEKHVACLQLREMDAEGVHQEYLPVIRNGIGEMVGNAFMHVLANGPAENGRQVAARFIHVDGDLGHGFAPEMAASSLPQAGRPAQC